MKRLTLIVVITALCMLPVIASAGDNGWKNFQGTYEMIASGSCIHSSLPYVKNDAGWWTAPLESVVYAGTTVWNGTWFFDKGGTGTFSYTLYATVTPPPAAQQPATPIPGGMRVFKGVDVPFTFSIDQFGDIIVKAQGLDLVGSISNDKKTMTLLSANTPQDFGGIFGYTICNTARTLIKIGDQWGAN